MTTTQRQLRRDTTANIGAITPAQGEPVFDVSRNALTLGDGAQAGGHYATPFGGAWTPVIQGDAGNPSVTYTNQEGWYCKIGKLVIAQGRTQVATISGGSGRLLLAGLPFLSSNASNSYGGVILSYVHDVAHASPSYTQFHAYVQPNTALIQLNESGSNVVANDTPVSALSANSDIIFMAIYEAASDNN